MKGKYFSMEETQTSGQTSEGGAQGDNQEQIDTGSKDTVKYESYRKVLGEKKRLASEYGEMKAELETLKQADLEAKGKQSELIDQLRKQNKELQDKFEKTHLSFGEKVLKSQVSAGAKAKGCVDTDALTQLADFSTVEIRDDYTVSDDDLSGVLEAAEKKYPYLFKKQAPTVTDGPLSNKKVETGGKSLEDIPLTERYRMLAEKTRKQG